MARNTNVWSMFSVDDELGYVYLPTGTPTGDYYGGHRLGDNLFAESLVALDIETGQRMWHFQAVHHGVWDYDFPAAPTLVDITVGGRPVKAVAQVSKQGFTYVFDRATGDQVWPIEKRPVATDTDLDGEVLSPTQPFPTKPPPFEHQGTSIDDLVDFTPEIRAMAVEAVKDFRLGPLFSPPMLSVDGGLQGTIQRPHVGGGASWTGAAVDPETGLLYVPSENRFSVLKYHTPDPDEGGNLRYTFTGLAAGIQPQMPQGLPLFKPPYSRMTAIDLNAGDHAWMHPNGDGDRFRNRVRAAERLSRLRPERRRYTRRTTGFRRRHDMARFLVLYRGGDASKLTPNENDALMKKWGKYMRFLSGIGAALAGSMANKSSIVIDLRGWRTPSVSGEELQALGKSGPRYTAEIARGLPVPRG